MAKRVYYTHIGSIMIYHSQLPVEMWRWAIALICNKQGIIAVSTYQ